jgi:hypothetical protein
MINLDRLFEDENKDILAKLEAESADILNRLQGKGAEGNSTLDSIRTSKSFEEISKEKWDTLHSGAGGGFPQYNSPFGKESIFAAEDDGYVEFIDFEKLLPAIAKFRKQGFDYKYTDFDSEISSPTRNLIALPDDIQELTDNVVQELEDYFGIKLPPSPISPTQKKVNNPYRDKDTGKVLSFEGKLNIREGYLPLDRAHTGFVFTLDIEKHDIKFSDYFHYKEDASKNYKSNVAIVISTNNYETYTKLSKIEDLYLSENSKQNIIGKFKTALPLARKKSDTLAWLYDSMPDFVLITLIDQDLWNDLQIIESGGINYIGINKYTTILKLLAAAKNYAWWVTKINETPSVMRILFEEFTNEYIPQLIFIAIKYGLATWSKEDYKNSQPYEFDTGEIDIDGDDSSDIRFTGYSVFIKELNKFKIGTIIQSFEKYSLSSSETIDREYGTVLAFEPLKTTIEKQTLFIPAFVAEHFTNEKIDEERKEMINFALLLMQPGDLIIANEAKATKDADKLLQTEKAVEEVFVLTQETRTLLQKWADNAVKGFVKADRPAVVSVLEGNGKRIFAYSNKTGLDLAELPKGLHPLVEQFLKDADEILKLRRTHGKCAEPAAISKWLWEIDPVGRMPIERARQEFEGVVSSAKSINSKAFSPKLHGKYIKACESCKPILKHFNIKEVF